MTSPTFAREPDFTQFLKVLRRQPPERPTLFEFYLNAPLYERLAGRPAPVRGSAGERDDLLAGYRTLGRWYADAAGAAGYDYVNFGPGEAFPGFHFREGAHEKASSHSLNEAALITSRADLESFAWPDPAMIDLGIIDALTADLPEGMEAMVYTPNGVLENLVDLVGYDNLCFMLVDDRELVSEIVAEIGESLLGLYRAVADH